MARNGVVSRRRKIDADFEELHVLAVDDSVIDRKVIERLLKISSCKVTAVDSGRRALQFLGLDEDKNKAAACDFHSLKVDLIITDYCMPGMTGYELLKKIKESSTLREIPVVIMSSENVLARIDRCLEEGAKDFIMKPVQLSDVKRLKDYTMTTREEIKIPIGNQDSGLNKRKSLEPADFIAPGPSPPSLVLSSPLPSPLSSLSDSTFNASLDSPTRRLKMTSCI